MNDIAVIGAGMSGLTAATELQRAGRKVDVFDKSRGVSGRMSTRRTDEDVRFDHGAQYFTARDHRFQQQVADWEAAGCAVRWSGRIVALEHEQVREVEQIARFVGLPGMNAICKDLSRTVEVKTGTRISQLERTSKGWLLFDEGNEPYGPYRAVICTLPAPQAAMLLEGHCSNAMQCSLAEQHLQPCWAVMLRLHERSEIPFDGAFVNENPLALSWIARDSSKPGRNTTAETWVLHGSPEWSATHLEDMPDKVTLLLINDFPTAGDTPSARNL